MTRKALRKTAAVIFSALLTATISYGINHLLQEHYRKITVARDTTYVLGPTFADGSIDCLSALNGQFSAGVTPENNAAVPLFYATNAKDRFIGWRLDALCALLGIKEPGDPRDPYADFPSFMLDRKLRAVGPEHAQALRNDEDLLREAWSDQIDAHVVAPWTRDQDPDAFDWLQSCARTLELVTAASKRDHLFLPLIGRRDLGSVARASLGGVSELRELTKLLGIRAMLSLGSHDFAVFRDDLLAQHRLGRLLLHTPQTMEALVGLAIIQQCNDETAGALSSLSAEQSRELLADLRALPALPDVTDCDDQGMRLETVAEISIMARFGPAAATMDDSDPSIPLPAPASLGFQPPIHFDDLLRQYNKLYDRRVAAARLPTFSQRRAAFDRFDAHCAAELARTTGSSSTDAILRLIYTAVDHSGRASVIRDKAREKSRLTELALLLSISRADHGAYPKDLSDIPDLRDSGKDLFADDVAIHYVASASLIYSVGPNQRDDAGIYAPPKETGRFQLGASPPPTRDYPDDIFVRLP